MPKVACPTCKKHLAVNKAGDDYCYYCLTQFTVGTNFKLEKFKKANWISKFSRTLTIYFLNTKEYTTTRIIFEFALIPLPLAFILIYLMAIFGISSPDNGGMIHRLIFFNPVLTTILLAPFVETFIGQVVPAWFFSKITRSTLTVVFFTALIFALLHLSNSPTYPIKIAPAAIFFAWGYILLKRKHFLWGYFGTFLIHAIYNTFALFIAFIISFIIPDESKFELSDEKIEKIIEIIKEPN